MLNPAFLIALAMAAPFGAAEPHRTSASFTWVLAAGYLDTYEASPVNVTATSFAYSNYSYTSSMIVDTAVIHPLYDKVYGAVTSSPPWTTTYSTLFDNSTNSSHPIYTGLAPRTWGYGRCRYSFVEGAERWLSGDAPYQAQRRRLKETEGEVDFVSWPIED